MRVLGTLLEGSGKYFVVCILLGLLLTVVEMIAPQVIRVTVDSVIDSQPMDLPAWALRWVESLGGVAFLRANMWFIALILALAGLVAALLRYGANMFNAKAGETLVKTARDRLFHHIECLPWKWHAEHPTGDIIQRCTSDVERIKNFFQEQFISVFQIIVRIILALTLMTLMNAKLSIVAWVIAPIIVPSGRVVNQLCSTSRWWNSRIWRAAFSSAATKAGSRPSSAASICSCGRRKLCSSTPSKRRQ